MCDFVENLSTLSNVKFHVVGEAVVLQYDPEDCDNVFTKNNEPIIAVGYGEGIYDNWAEEQPLTTVDWYLLGQV